ncbi:MAG: TrmH family RNA methyltransferase, partial [Patescibacteria group bacterium]|nr:TrmH family RNA methyltransferase [Patescibacteria group bacterium]
MSLKLNAKQLRKSKGKRQKSKIKRNDIYIVLDNVLDTYNIGSVFRLADAVAAKKIYLCGGTATPPNPRIKKASINTTEWVDWEYAESTVELIRKLQSSISNLQVVVVEQ